MARPLKAPNANREIALVWRKNSPRGDEFRMLAKELRTGQVCWRSTANTWCRWQIEEMRSGSAGLWYGYGYRVFRAPQGSIRDGR